MKCLYRPLFYFFVIIFYSGVIYPQYTANDYDLVKITFNRSFDKEIINTYLLSKDPVKIKAALLSISHSADTSFSKTIISTGYSLSPEALIGPFYFSLGQLGSCFTTSNFLINRLDSSRNEDESRLILEALGKTGSSAVLDELKSRNIKRLTPALYNFANRNIGDKEWIVKCISDELQNSENIKEIYESAFALYRIGPGEYSKKMLHKKTFEVINTAESEDKISAIQYLLGCYRKLKWFPDDISLFNEILKIDEFAVKIEAAKVFCYFNFRDKEQLDRYLSLIGNGNQNISRQAAISIKELSLAGTLKEYLKGFIISELGESKSVHVKGELVSSFGKLFSIPFKTIKEYFDLLTNEYIYRICSEYKESEEAYEFLKTGYHAGNDKDQIFLLQALLVFKPDDAIIFNSLSSSSPPLISISADAVDSSFISGDKNTLKEIIISQLNKYKDSSNFSESILSLYNLSLKIDEDFIDKVKDILSSSSLYSIKKIIGIKAEKDAGIFETLWSNAFKYSEAEVSTSMGNFTIKLLPEIAPISAGNFIYLASGKFFNGILFHRVVPGFVIQGGDPSGTGWSGPGYEIISEYSDYNYSAGTVGMASSGKDKEGSQWFVTTAAYPHLNGRYSVFGVINEGWDITNKIEQDDKIINIKLK